MILRTSALHRPAPGSPIRRLGEAIGAAYPRSTTTGRPNLARSAAISPASSTTASSNAVAQRPTAAAECASLPPVATSPNSAATPSNIRHEWRESSAFSAKDSLFAHLGKHEIFTPVKTYPAMTLVELAAA